MSFDVELVDQENQAVIVDSHQEGATIALGGTNIANMNITYNYGKLIREYMHPEGLRWLDGKTAKETISYLNKACIALPDEPYEGPNWQPIIFPSDEGKSKWEELFGLPMHDTDLESFEGTPALAQAISIGLVQDGGAYWKPTPGNVGHALRILLSWGKQHPKGIWRID